MMNAPKRPTHFEQMFSVDRKRKQEKETPKSRFQQLYFIVTLLGVCLYPFFIVGSIPLAIVFMIDKK
ncbi:TPA: hypothetical protein ACMV5C_002054, partial [Enterococcus faecium]|nr:hypothetical protein [Enterococcus faecium]